MNVLVIGSGGREHALAYGLKKSAKIGDIYIAPGNAGINRLAKPVMIAINQPDEVIKFAKQKNISLVVIGPEAPLVEGLTDYLEDAGLLVFGVSKKAAQLEGSKEFTKDICRKYNIPTADYESFRNADKAKEYLAKSSFPIVIKADGLAAGKGVVIANDLAQATDAICLVPECNGIYYCDLPSKEELWDRYYTAAPKRLRQHVEQYKIVKRA